ncbi:MAG: hypothetical protein PHD07_04105 [Bacteroidales bacterium]|nr:hypothetical protein [Bacteroidales bacterium]
MRLYISESKNSKTLYVIKSFRKNGKSTSKIVERLGSYDEIKERIGELDPVEWAKQYIEELNEKERKQQREISAKFSTLKQIKKDRKVFYGGGYLFLQRIYYNLGIDKICREIETRYETDFDLSEILSRLIYCKMLEPSPDIGTLEYSRLFIEQSYFTQSQINRALSILSREMDNIQAELYQNSKQLFKRKVDEVFYSSSNFYLKLELSDKYKRRKAIKEGSTGPVSQIGLYVDNNSLPMGFTISQRESKGRSTIKSIEKKISENLAESKFVVCTDESLFSPRNFKGNEDSPAYFITNQSIKTLGIRLRDWACDPTGWSLAGSGEVYDLRNLNYSTDYEKIFYKERKIKKRGIEQRLINTFSIKEKEAIQALRQDQIDRARQLIASGSMQIHPRRRDDNRRFVRHQYNSADGEISATIVLSVGQRQLKQQMQYDGFSAVRTNLLDDVPSILRIKKGRSKIDEMFGSLKPEYKEASSLLQRGERIKAHFLVCFLSLTIFRVMEASLEYKYTFQEIIGTLQQLYFFNITGEGYVPAYIRTELTDCLHEVVGFQTDYEIISNERMKNIIFASKY